MDETARAEGDGRGGVIWHTQGSGKSLTMAFLAGKRIAEPALANPTIVVAWISTVSTMACSRAAPISFARRPSKPTPIRSPASCSVEPAAAACSPNPERSRPPQQPPRTRR
jgi:hypothetical protein